MTLLESINKRAEEKYPEHPTGTASVVNHYAIEFEQPAYISGCRDQYELDMEFIKWMVKRKVSPISGDMWEDWGAADEENQIVPMRTLEQLFVNFINNVKQVL